MEGGGSSSSMNTASSSKKWKSTAKKVGVGVISGAATGAVYNIAKKL